MRSLYPMRYWLLLVVACLPCSLRAAEIEPRAYVNTPIGVNFLVAGYAYTDGGLSTDASSPLQDAQLTIDTEAFAYAHTIDVMGKSAKFDMILGHSSLEGTALFAGQSRARKVNGLNDPRFRFSMNFYGAPALSLEDFRNYHQDLIIGASLQVSPPLGQYDHDRLVNLGNNRWYFKPDIGISKAWGPLVVELSNGVYLFTDNDDYFGGKRLEQDPVYASQLHVTYNFSHGIWFALSGTSERGGRTTVNDVTNDDEQDNSRLGATLAMSLDKNNSLKLYASNSLHTNVGTDYDLYGIAWQYRWGSGL